MAQGGPWAALPWAFPRQVGAEQRCLFKGWCNPSCLGHSGPTHVTPQESGSCLPHRSVVMTEPRGPPPPPRVQRSPRPARRELWSGHTEGQTSGTRLHPGLAGRDKSEKGLARLPAHLGPSFLQSSEAEGAKEGEQARNGSRKRGEMDSWVPGALLRRRRNRAGSDAREVCVVQSRCPVRVTWPMPVTTSASHFCWTGGMEDSGGRGREKDKFYKGHHHSSHEPTTYCVSNKVPSASQSIYTTTLQGRC